MKYCVADILSILDDGARQFVFPMLDNGYVYLAAARLNLFRSPQDWALVFETFGFSPRAGMPDLLVTTFSSNPVHSKTKSDFISKEAYDSYLSSHQYYEQVFYHPIDDDRWIDPQDGELVQSDALSLSLRGQLEPLPSAKDYADAGVVCKNQLQPMVFELCRALAYLRRNEVLATNSECAASLLPDLEHILTVNDWHHPDVVDPEVLPSQSQTFRQFADVLVSGDISIYQPEAQANAHWSNWPEGGTL